MYTKYILLACSLMSLLSSCQLNHRREVKSIRPSNKSLMELKVLNPISPIKTYSSLFTSVRLVNLETTKDCLIGDIHSLRIDGNDMYIIHYISSSSSLLRFNTDGRFLNVIGKKIGRGPSEIMNPRDFCLDNNIIEVWSKLNISKFSKEGAFIKKTFNAYVPGVGFFKDDGFYYLFHSASPPYMLTKYKSHGGIKTRFLPYNYIDAVSSNDKVLFYNNHVSLFSSVSDTIYTFINGDVIPSAYFNFVNMTSAHSSLKKSKHITEFLTNLKNNCVITNYFENSNYIFFEFSYNKKVSYCLYDKENRKSKYFDNKIIDDITNLTFNTPICLTDDNCLVIPVYDYEINSKKNKNSLSLSSDLYNNPILLFCKLNTVF